MENNSCSSCQSGDSKSGTKPTGTGLLSASLILPLKRESEEGKTDIRSPSHITKATFSCSLFRFLGGLIFPIICVNLVFVGPKKIRMLLYLKLCSWNGTFIALVYQMAKKVRITKGNHIVSYFLFAVNISVSEKARNLPDTKSVTFFPRNTFLLYDHTLFWARSSDIMILDSFVDFWIKISIYWVVSEGWVAWFPHGWVRSLIV